MDDVRDSPGTAFERLVAERLPALLRLAVMLTGDRVEAEDLVQTALVKAWRHSGRIVTRAAPAAYLRRIVVHEHASGHRRRRHETVPFDDSLADRVPGGVPADPDATEAVVDSDALWRALATLPARQRAVLVLRIYEDLDDREIADLLGVGESTVRSNASRALGSLRSQLTSAKTLEPR